MCMYTQIKYTRQTIGIFKQLENAIKIKNSGDNIVVVVCCRPKIDEVVIVVASQPIVWQLLQFYLLLQKQQLKNHAS